MSDYTYSEMKNMQQRAMERVREMNRTSETALQMAKKELEGDEKTVKYEEKKRSNSNSIKTKHINMPPNFPKERQYPTFKEHFEEEEKKGITKNAGFLDGIIDEPDRALLLGLIALLKSEGADEALMLALAYIML